MPSTHDDRLRTALTYGFRWDPAVKAWVNIAGIRVQPLDNGFIVVRPGESFLSHPTTYPTFEDALAAGQALEE